MGGIRVRSGIYSNRTPPNLPEYAEEWSDTVYKVDCPCCGGKKTFQRPTMADRQRGVLRACENCGTSPDFNDSPYKKEQFDSPCARRSKLHELTARHPVWYKPCPRCGADWSLRMTLDEDPFCESCAARDPQESYIRFFPEIVGVNPRDRALMAELLAEES